MDEARPVGLETVELRTLFHFDSELRIYALTQSELTQLESEPQSSWRSLFLAAVSICFATALNAISGLAVKPFAVTLPFFLNALFGAVSFFSSIILGAAWWQSARFRRNLFKTIRDKEELVLTPGGLGRARRTQEEAVTD